LEFITAQFIDAVQPQQTSFLLTRSARATLSKQNAEKLVRAGQKTGEE